MGKRINIENQVFNNWLVLYRTSGSMYKCKCLLCGYTEELNSYKLRNNISKRCPKCYAILKGEEQRERLENTQINDWYVKEYIGNGLYECKCKCGNTRNIYAGQLKNNNTHRCEECNAKLKSENQREKLEGLIVNGNIVKRYIGDSTYECQCYCKRMFTARAYNIKKNEIYGCEQCSHEVLKNKYRETMYNRYEDISSKKIQNIREKWQIETLDSKEKIEKFIADAKAELKREPTSSELADRLGISCHILLCYLRHYNIKLYSTEVSDKEIELRKQLIGPLVEYNNKTLIDPMEIDIYFPEQKVGIEFNGTYWHSHLFKDKIYHQNKTILAAQNKVKLIHIFEHEWDDINKREKLIKFLRSKIGITPQSKIFARKTKIVTVDVAEEKRFLSENHLQGYSSSSVCYGLKYNNELIALMSFGRPRFNNEYEWELVRLAYKEDVKVIGGTEKMFKAFLDRFKPNSIISYCDISKFNGTVYTRLGFKATNKDLTSPNYMWVNPIKNEALPRYKTMKHKLIKQGYGTEEDTENSIMERLGYLKVYDCGNLRFTWKRSENS